MKTQSESLQLTQSEELTELYVKYGELLESIDVTTTIGLIEYTKMKLEELRLEYELNTDERHMIRTDIENYIESMQKLRIQLAEEQAPQKVIAV